MLYEIIRFIVNTYISFAQTNFVSNSSYESNFQLVQREIASVYNPKTTNFTGNKYFFKKSKDAVLDLLIVMNLLNVKTNYNLLDQTFDIVSDDNEKTLKTTTKQN